MESADQLDWALLSAVRAVAEHGSLSAAARAIGSSQPTLGRQIHTAEAALGCTLFERHPRGLVPSEACTALLPQLHTMAEAAARLQLAASGFRAGVEGTVRITASTTVALHQLPRALARMRLDEPRIRYDVVPSDSVESLLFGKADIAIRMFRPTTPDMVVRFLGEIKLGLFAHETYLARRGAPKTAADMLAHDLVGYDSDTRIIDFMTSVGLPVTRAHFVARSDSDVHYMALIGAGLGIGAMQLRLGQQTPGLVQILPDTPLPVLPAHLVAQADLLRNPRVRAAWDMLARYLLA